MTPERWHQITEIYHAARECDPAVHLRPVRAPHAPNHRIGAIVAAHTNLGDRDVAGCERLIERIVDFAQHVTRVCQVATCC